MKQQLCMVPRIGDWYLTPQGQKFEVVAIDHADGAIEVQHFDGEIEAFDSDTWAELHLDMMAPPEDWSGSFDMSVEDYGVEFSDIQIPRWLNTVNAIDGAIDREFDVRFI